MDVINQWNMNMNMLGAGDYQLPRELMVWGFAVQMDSERQGYIFLEENECVRCWYNAHCDSACRQLSAIQVEHVQKAVLDDKYLDIFGKKLLLSELFSVKRAYDEKFAIEPVREFEAFSLIWNGLTCGVAENKLSLTDMREQGYGLIYKEDHEWHTFFDNRLASMFHKMQELQRNHIRPLCVPIKKEGQRPIPVATGRKRLLQLLQDKALEEFYWIMQR